MKSRPLALLALFMVQLLYGINYTFAKGVINDGYIQPFGFVLLRLIGATALFWILNLFLPQEKIEKKDFGKIFLAAVFGVFINMLFFFMHYL